MAPSADDGFDDAELPTSRGAPRKAFLLRIPPSLHDELRRWAAREMRSLNAQVEYLLREAVRKKRGSGGSDGPERPGVPGDEVGDEGGD